VSVYKESNLENSLDGAARNFVNDNFRLNGNEIHISKLLLWYASDFGQNDKDIIRWLLRYLSETTQQTVEEVIKSDKFTIKYDAYDWLINSK